jgi:hypothetical protein
MRSEKLREEMFSLCRQWEESGETRESFCNRHQINIGKFSYWRSQYMSEEKPQEDDFLAISPAVNSGMEIRYPNGVVIKIPGKTPLVELKALICLI